MPFQLRFRKCPIGPNYAGSHIHIARFDEASLVSQESFDARLVHQVSWPYLLFDYRRLYDCHIHPTDAEDCEPFLKLEDFLPGGSQGNVRGKVYFVHLVRKDGVLDRDLRPRMWESRTTMPWWTKGLKGEVEQENDGAGITSDRPRSRSQPVPVSGEGHREAVTASRTHEDRPTLPAPRPRPTQQPQSGTASKADEDRKNLPAPAQYQRKNAFSGPSTSGPRPFSLTTGPRYTQQSQRTIEPDSIKPMPAESAPLVSAAVAAAGPSKKATSSMQPTANTEKGKKKAQAQPRRRHTQKTQDTTSASTVLPEQAEQPAVPASSSSDPPATTGSRPKRRSASLKTTSSRKGDNENAGKQKADKSNENDKVMCIKVGSQPEKDMGTSSSDVLPCICLVVAYVNLGPGSVTYHAVPSWEINGRMTGDYSTAKRIEDVSQMDEADVELVEDFEDEYEGDNLRFMSSLDYPVLEIAREPRSYVQTERVHPPNWVESKGVGPPRTTPPNTKPKDNIDAVVVFANSPIDGSINLKANMQVDLKHSETFDEMYDWVISLQHNDDKTLDEASEEEGLGKDYVVRLWVLPQNEEHTMYQWTKESGLVARNFLDRGFWPKYKNLFMEVRIVQRDDGKGKK